MTITTKKVIKTELNQHDKAALINTIAMLNDLRGAAERYETLMSVDTGEVIEMEELRRVQAILDGLLTQDLWEVIQVD
jgi:hypothetical protein